jgi:hypothetical protein
MSEILDELLIPDINYDDLKDDLLVATGIGKNGDDSKLRVAYNAASRYANGLIAGAQVDQRRFRAVLSTSLFEMTILRFNRLEEEGMKSREQDGESITWSGQMYEPWDEKLKSVVIDNEATGWIVTMYTADEYSTSETYETYHPFFGSNVWTWQNDGEPWRTIS